MANFKCFLWSNLFLEAWLQCPGPNYFPFDDKCGRTSPSLGTPFQTVKTLSILQMVFEETFRKFRVFKNLLVHNFLYKNRQKKVSQNIFFSDYSSTKYKNSKQLFFEKFYPKLTFSTLSLTLKVSIFETSSLNVSPNGTQVSAYFIINLPL